MKIHQTHLQYSIRNCQSQPKKQQSGFALIIVLLLVVVGSIIVASQSKITRTDMKVAHNNQLGVQALAVAEAGIYHTFRTIFDSTNLDNELKDLGIKGAMEDIGNPVDLDGDGTPDHQFEAFGGTAADGYFVRVEDNFDDTPNDTTSDQDETINIISIGRLATAERTIKARMRRDPVFPGLFGITGVFMNGNTTINSYKPSKGLGARNNADVGSNGTVTMSGGSLDVKGSVSVPTTGTINDPHNTITGKEITDADPLIFPSVPACGGPYSDGTGITQTDGGGVPVVIDGVDLALNGNLNISGGDISFAAGTYCLNRLSITSSATLTINGAVTLNLVGDSSLTGGGVVNNTSDAKDLRINVSPTGINFSILGGAQMFAYLYAPDSTINITGNSDFYGRAIGNIINVLGNTTFHVDETFVLGEMKLVSWREVKD